MRSPIAAPLLVAAFAFAPAASAAVNPFHAIGPARLGMTAAQVRAEHRADLDVEFVGGRVARISTQSREQRLPGGVGVGTAASALSDRLPGASCVSTRREAVCSLTEGPLRRVRATRLVIRDGKVVAIAVERSTTRLAPVLPAGRRVLLGRSTRGRPISAVRYGDPDSPRKALAVAATHGDEPLSPAVVRLLEGHDVRGVDLWVVNVLNPDGLAVGRRQNATGTDLNRNFSAGWRPGTPGDRFYPGPEPFSAPESRVVRDLTHLLRPAVSLWFHQPYGYVVPPIGGSLDVARRYARLAGYTVDNPVGPRARGQAPTWQNAAYPGTTAFIVELPAGPLSPAALQRHARATVAIAAGR